MTINTYELIDNGVDGQALLELTERQKERLVGHVKKEMILSKAIADLKKTSSGGVEEEVHSNSPDVSEPIEETSSDFTDEDPDHNILNAEDLRTYK